MISRRTTPYDNSHIASPNVDFSKFGALNPLASLDCLLPEPISGSCCVLRGK